MMHIFPSAISYILYMVALLTINVLSVFSVTTVIHAKTRIAAVNRSVGEFEKDLTQFGRMYWLHQYVLQRQSDSSTKSLNYQISSALSSHAGRHVIILDPWLYLSANLPSLRNLLDVYGMDLSYHLIAMTLLWGMLFPPHQIRGHSTFLATGQ